MINKIESIRKVLVDFIKNNADSLQFSHDVEWQVKSMIINELYPLLTDEESIKEGLWNILILGELIGEKKLDDKSK